VPPVNYSDEILLKELGNSSHEACEALFHRYWKQCFSVAWQKTGDEQEAMDIVQNLFIHIWEIRTSLPHDLHLPSYLAKAMKNRVLNWYRNLERNDARKAAWLQQLQAHNTLQSVNHPVHLQELHQEWSHAIDSLPERMKEIYVLSRQHELSVPEIAQKLNLRPQSVKNQLAVAVQRIRKLLAQYYIMWLIIVVGLFLLC
jgi:RNA polymerase sigma-70 factor (ECF subfamily)